MNRRSVPPHYGRLALSVAVVLSVLSPLRAFAADPTGSNTNTAYVAPVFKFATLPATTLGTVVAINDGLAANCADTTCTTFGTAVTGGGGALKLLLWYDGAGWTLIGK